MKISTKVMKTKDLSLQERVVEIVVMKLTSFVLKTHISVAKMTLKSLKYKNQPETAKNNNNNNLATNNIVKII